MAHLKAFLPSCSTFLHLRFFFSVFLLPVFFFALSQVPEINWNNAILTFIIWHLLVYPASNGYNSFFDKDEGSIALIEKPPPVDKSLYYFLSAGHYFLRSLFTGRFLRCIAILQLG
jgi:1,4-dihydroxy-2-naphthoate octaprenyltransferase